MVTDSFMLSCFQWVQCWQQGCGWLRQIRLLSPQFAQGSFHMGELVLPMVFFLSVGYGVSGTTARVFDCSRGVHPVVPGRIAPEGRNYFYGNS